MNYLKFEIRLLQNCIKNHKQNIVSTPLSGDAFLMKIVFMHQKSFQFVNIPRWCLLMRRDCEMVWFVIFVMKSRKAFFQVYILTLLSLCFVLFFGCMVQVGNRKWFTNENRNKAFMVLTFSGKQTNNIVKESCTFNLCVDREVLYF